MEKIKIDNFLKEFPDRDFPAHASLSKNECSKIIRMIKEKFGFPNVVDDLNLVEFVDSITMPCREISNVKDNFDLNEFMKLHEINAADFIYINWYRYNKIDKLKRCDIAGNFYDLWYQGADDIDVFDDSFDWILSIRHDGYIKLWINKDNELAVNT